MLHSVDIALYNVPRLTICITISCCTLFMLHYLMLHYFNDSSCDIPPF